MFTAHYFRYAAPGSEEFDSLDEALRFLAWQEDLGRLTSDRIVGPDGQVLSGKTLDERIWSLI